MVAEQETSLKRNRMKVFTKYSNLWAAFLLVVMAILAITSMAGDSGITDEVAHIPAGYSYLKFQDYRLNPEHPPLVKALSAVPLLFMNLRFPLEHVCWAEDVNGQWECGWQFIYHIGNNADQILFWSRIPIVLLALLLGFFIFKWTKELYGPRTALFALFLYSFSPNILAHSRYVTTDLGLCVFFFISVYYFCKFVRKPCWLNLILAGLTFGLAQLSKFSAILLVPYFILLTIVILLVKRKTFKIFVPALLLIFIIGYLLVGAVYQFTIAKMPLDLQHRLIDESLASDLEIAGMTRDTLHNLTNFSLGRPYAQYFTGLIMVFSHMAGGHTTYFLGETSNQGWWYFFIIAFLIKTPITVLILVLLTFFLFAKDFITSFKSYPVQSGMNGLSRACKKITVYLWQHFEKFVFATCILMWIVVGMKSKLNIGLRYILPIYPFMFVLVAKEVIAFIQSKKQKIKSCFVIILVVLMVWYVGANIFIFPSYLAYFNEFIVGPKNGYKYMVDSNLDWGQDLKRLAKWVDEKGIDKIKVDYFGGSVPEYYLGDKYMKWRSQDGPTTGWLAISATYFQTSKWWKKTSGQEDYTWLERYEPVEQIGYSILIYHITHNM